MMKRTITIVAALALLGLTQTTKAGVIETSTNRYLLTDAVGGFTEDGPHNIPGPSIYGVFNQFSEPSAVEGNNGGSVYADQDSLVSPGHYTATLGAYASAFGDGSDFASAYAQSHFEVKFTLTSTESFAISGAAGGAFGAINGETSRTVIKINSLGGGSPTILILDEDNDYPSFSQSGSLLPGNYSLTVDSLAIVDRIFESGFGDANAGVIGLDMTITPEPATLGMILIGGIAMLRRRR